MEIAVLGGGNGSHAAAVDLTEAGHKVRFWRRDADAVKALNAADNTLVLKDFKGERPVTLAMATGDMGAALAGAELIVCPAPAPAQASFSASSVAVARSTTLHLHNHGANTWTVSAVTSGPRGLE